MRIATAYKRLAASLALCALLSMSLATSPAFAAPSTPEIAAKQAEAAQAQADLQAMNDELEVQIEAYNAITEALEQTRVEIRDTQAELERAKQDLSVSETTLANRATSIYKQRGTGLLEVFLGARSFEDFILRLDLAMRIGRSDAGMVTDVKTAKARVEQAEQALLQRESEQVALQTDAESRALGIEAKVAEQQRFVSGLNGEVKVLIAAEEERQRQIAAERARQAALAARSGNTGTERAAADPGSLSSGHPEVVAIALQFLGVPYVWGGSSPSGFDCSGLTQYCYRQIGISLPRTSQSQFQAGQHIARDRLDLLRPGDLVFFGTDGDAGRVHHVGIYVGDGNYVHAPYTGTVIRVNSLVERIESNGDYVGASRL